MLVLMRTSICKCIVLTGGIRYWGANIHWELRPDMSQREREKLIHRKYVLKEFVDRSESWELEMQKKYPLTQDELAVLDYVNARRHVKPSTQPEVSVPMTKAKQRHSKNFRGREKKSVYKDEGRWSDEIVCDGRSVTVAKVTIQDDRAPRLSEKVINDGRMRGRAIPVKDNW